MGYSTQSQDAHEQFLSEKFIFFKCLNTSMSFKYIVPTSGNIYRFERDQPRLIKDKRDIEHFKEMKHLFEEIGNETKKSDEDIKEETKKKGVKKFK